MRQKVKIRAVGLIGMRIRKSFYSDKKILLAEKRLQEILIFMLYCKVLIL